MNKFNIVTGVYIGILLLNIVYFVIPALTLITDDLLFYIVMITAPLLPLALLLKKIPIIIEHELEIKGLTIAIMLLSLFATIIYAIPVIL